MLPKKNDSILWYAADMNAAWIHFHTKLTNCRNERRFKCSNCPLNGRQLTENCPLDQLTNIQRRMRCVLFDRDCCLLRSNDFFLYGASRAVCKIRAPRFQYVSAATISVYLAFCVCVIFGTSDREDRHSMRRCECDATIVLCSVAVHDTHSIYLSHINIDRIRRLARAVVVYLIPIARIGCMRVG